MANDDFKKIGAGWKKKSKNGNNYLALSFDAQALENLDLSRMNVMVFQVKEKKNPNSPDYTVSATEKRQQQAPARPAPKPAHQSPGAGLGFDDSDDF